MFHRFGMGWSQIKTTCCQETARASPSTIEESITEACDQGKQLGQRRCEPLRPMSFPEFAVRKIITQHRHDTPKFLNVAALRLHRTTPSERRWQSRRWFKFNVSRMAWSVTVSVGAPGKFILGRFIQHCFVHVDVSSGLPKIGKMQQEKA